MTHRSTVCNCDKVPLNNFFSISLSLQCYFTFLANVTVEHMLVCVLLCLRSWADGSTQSLSTVAQTPLCQDSQTAVSSVRDFCTDCTSTFTPTCTFHCASTYISLFVVINLFYFTSLWQSGFLFFFSIHWYSGMLARGGNLLKNMEGVVTSQLRWRCHPRGLVCLDSWPQS